MKAAIITGVLLGFSGVIALAGFYPWVDHPRPISRTEVLPNGGRSENFTIRLPADRIAVAADQVFAGPRGQQFPEDLLSAASLESGGLAAEHFKLRDGAGEVVGLAVRHVTVLPTGEHTAWSLMLPSRGALWLAGEEDRNLIASTLESQGFRPNSGAFATDIRVEATGGTGQVFGGSREFKDLVGSYEEEWRLTGVTDTGALRGTVLLRTITRKGS